jgi:hypothetical protein
MLNSISGTIKLSPSTAPGSNYEQELTFEVSSNCTFYEISMEMKVISRTSKLFLLLHVTFEVLIAINFSVQEFREAW